MMPAYARSYLVPMAASHCARAMALIESIFEQERLEHRIFVLCLDEQCATALASVRMPQLVVVRPADLALSERLDMPSVLFALMAQRREIDTLVYLAPERYLFGRADALGSREAAVQLWRPAADRPIDRGIAVVRRSRGGEAALQRWCELAGDGQLERIAALAGMSVAIEPARSLAAGDFARADFTVQDGAPCLAGAPLWSADFAELAMITPELLIPQRDPHQGLSRAALVAVFAPYADALARAACWVRAAFDGSLPGLLPAGALSLEHTVLAARGLRAMVARHKLPGDAPRALVELDAVWDAHCSQQVRGSPALPNERVKKKWPPCPDSRILKSSRVDKRPRVSALVSSYRADAFIRGCIEDLTRQTLFAKGELEIVVIDSASPGRESAIVSELIDRYPNIVLARTDEREGVYMAWNRAAALGRGEYLTNANTDDRHRHDALERLAATLDAHPEVALIYADSLITRQAHSTFAEAPVAARLAWPAYEHARLVHTPHVGPQPLWRRRLHEQIGWFDARYVVAADYEMWLRFAEHHPLYHLDDTLGLYLHRNDSVEHANLRACQRETCSVRMMFARRHGCELTPERYLPRYLDTCDEPRVRVQRLEREALGTARPKAATKRATLLPAAPSLVPGPWSLVDRVESNMDPTKSRFACAVLVMVPDSAAALQRCLGTLVDCTPSYISYQAVLLVRQAGEPVRRILDDLGGDVVIVRSDPALDEMSAFRTAVTASQSEVVVLLDCATAVTEGWLDPLLRTLELDPLAAAVQGRRVTMGAAAADAHERIGAVAVRRSALSCFDRQNGSAPRATSYAQAVDLLRLAIENEGARVLHQPRSSVVVATARAPASFAAA